MEVLYKTLRFLCLSSAITALQLTPSLNIMTPIGVELGIGEINTNLLNKVNSKGNVQTSRQQCFCLPNNANSQPVISYLDPKTENLQRIVMFIYKSDGAMKVYIPNKNKQQLIPELNFDIIEGDILKPVTSESVVELFDLDIVKPQQTIVTLTEEIINESETIGVETNDPQKINMNIDSDQPLIESIDYSSIIPSDVSSSLEEVKPLDDQNVLITDTFQPTEQLQIEEINDPELNTNTNFADVDQLNHVTSILSPNHQTISSPVEVISSQELDVIPELNNFDPLVTPILPTNLQSSDIQESVNINGLETNSNLNNYDSFQKIFSLLQSQSSLQPNPVDLLVNNHITFYDWFDKQLKNVVLYNLGTSSKVTQFRERIKKVLQDNGMIFNIKGIVTDTNGNLVRLNNIKLRPILIGSQVDYQSSLKQQGNLANDAISYVQFLEIIQTNPPKLLGTLVMGTVYLPRNVLGGQKVNSWNDNQSEKNKHIFGCTTCKAKLPQNPYSHVTGQHINSPVIDLPYGQYYGLPLRRKFNTRTQNFLANVPNKKQTIAKAEPQRRVSNDINRSGLGSVVGELLENFGIAPTLITNPTRRLLGGVLPSGVKPGPKTYPNEVFPGYRIVGGNAATSSGTPLVSKGRSGFQKPSQII